MRLFLILSFFSVSTIFFSCNQEDDCEADNNANCACYEIYAPVCGCDGVTYPNDCYAECAGIDDYSEGTCD